MGQKPCRNTACWLAQLPSIFCPGNGASHHGLGSPTSNDSQDNPSQTGPQTNLIKSAPVQMVLGCVELTVRVTRTPGGVASNISPLGTVSAFIAAIKYQINIAKSRKDLFCCTVLEVSVCGPWTYCFEECVVEEARKKGEKQNFPSNGRSLGPTSSY